MKKRVFYLGALLVLAILSPIVSFAQIDTTLVSDPATVVSAQNVEALTVAITVILSFLAGLIPGVKNIKASWLRSIAVGFIVVVASVSFKLGWFNQASFSVILTTLFPTFAYSGTVWEGLKFVLGLVGIDIKNLRPTPTPKA
jgi:hypothetical protein